MVPNTKKMFSGNYENTALHTLLPHGWEERFTTNGQSYYVNHVTRTTQWLHPGNDKNLKNERMPEGWTMQVAPNRRVFFINHKDKKTTFVDPRTGRPSPLPPPPLPPHEQREEELGSLPEGWEERVHADGRSFYINHSTRQTQWEDPR